MKTVIPTILCITGLLLCSCQNNKKTKPMQPSKSQTEEKIPEKPARATKAFDPDSLGQEPVFIMKTSLGDMVFKLYKDTPKHRDNFVRLASERYYDGLLFHRVINGFMIQGGDPDSRGAAADRRLGMGGPGYQIPAEILPHHRHKKGALAAARNNNPEKASSGSQFYIVHSAANCAGLDGLYTVYGEVLEGLDVIDKIASVPTGVADRPLKDVVILSVLPKK